MERGDKKKWNARCYIHHKVQWKQWSGMLRSTHCLFDENIFFWQNQVYLLLRFIFIWIKSNGVWGLCFWSIFFFKNIDDGKRLDNKCRVRSVAKNSTNLHMCETYKWIKIQPIWMVINLQPAVKQIMHYKES